MKSTRSRNAGELHYLTNLTPLQKHSKKQFVWSFRIVVSLFNQILTCKKSGSQLFESLPVTVNSKLENRSEGHDMVMTKSWLNLNATEYSDIKVDNIKHHAVTHSFSRRCHNLCTTVPAQSKSTRTGNTDALSDSGMLAWCTWPLPGSILSPLSKILQIPRSTSLYFWHLNPAHNCLNRYCQCQAEKKRSEGPWHGHDKVMTESECNWIPRHQSGQHQAPCCHAQFQSPLSQSLHHRSPHKANQPGRVIRMHYQTPECLHDALDHCLVQFFLHCLKFYKFHDLHPCIPDT